MRCSSGEGAVTGAVLGVSGDWSHLLAAAGRAGPRQCWQEQEAERKGQALAPPPRAGS